MNATRLAYGSLIGLLALAFAAAWLLQGSELLSRVPPPTAANPTPVADVADGAELALYQSAFTAWATVVLLIPAYLTVWRRDAKGREVWRAFWTVSWIAYIIHLLVSMFLFFGGDFGWMTSTSRVSAFWPGMLISLWWPLDILLARKHGGWISLQRVLIHVLVLGLFVGGSAVKGELLTIQMLGWVLVGASVGAALLYALRRRGHAHAL